MSKPRTLLIDPPVTRAGESRILTKVPLGIAYLAGYLEKHEYPVRIVDSLIYTEHSEELAENTYRIGLSHDRIGDIVREFRPDIVGMGCAYTVYEQDSFSLARYIKGIDERILVIAGGAHTSGSPESVLKCPEIDVAVIGEGEETLLDIVRHLERGEDISTLKGTAVREGAAIRINQPREYIEDLDSIPFPARHLLDMDRYIKHPSNSLVAMRGPTTVVVSSRGCPYNCIFCSIKTVWGRKWRGRSARNVADELEHLHKTYGIREFRFFDDNLTCNKARMIEICDEIMRRQLDIRWDTPNGVAIAALDEEVLARMKQAGYYRIVMGIESGSEEILRFMRKPVKLEKAKELIRICHKLGIWTWSTFVFGFPNEKLDTIMETIEYAKKSGLNFVTFYIAQPYAGTELNEIFEREGLLAGKAGENSSLTSTTIDTKHFTAQELRDLHKYAMKSFFVHKAASYLNPFVLYREVLSKMRTFEDVRFFCKMLGVFARCVMPQVGG